MPFLLTGATLTYWMTRIGVDLTTIGIFALVGHALRLQVRLGAAGRPVAAAAARPLAGPAAQLDAAGAGRHLAVGRAAGLERSRQHAVVRPRPRRSLVAFFSATQDIAVDAYRIEILRDEEQGAGSATTQLGYRIALWIVDAMALLLPSLLPWPVVLSLIALLIVVGIVDHASTPTSRRPSGRRSARREALGQAGGRSARSPSSSPIAAGSSSCCSRCSTSTATRWAAPWRGRSSTQMGFTGPEIFGVTKSFGVAATILGGLAGGIVVARYGLFKALLIARHPAGGHQPPVLVAGACRPRPRRADDRHQRRQLHRRAGRRRLHRLPVEPRARTAWRARSMRC